MLVVWVEFEDFPSADVVCNAIRPQLEGRVPADLLEILTDLLHDYFYERWQGHVRLRNAYGVGVLTGAKLELWDRVFDVGGHSIEVTCGLRNGFGTAQWHALLTEDNNTGWGWKWNRSMADAFEDGDLPAAVRELFSRRRGI